MSEMVPVETPCPLWDGIANRAGRRRHRRCSTCRGSLVVIKYMPADPEDGDR